MYSSSSDLYSLSRLLLLLRFSAYFSPTTLNGSGFILLASLSSNLVLICALHLPYNSYPTTRIIGIPTMMLVTCLAAFLYFGGSLVLGVGSMMRWGYRGARGGARGAGPAKAVRCLGSSGYGEGARRGFWGSGIVVARAFGGIVLARSLGAAVVGGVLGRGDTPSVGCWIGAPGAGVGGCGALGVLDVGAASAFPMGVFAAAGRIGATGAGPGTGGRNGSLGSVDGDDGGS